MSVTNVVAVVLLTQLSLALNIWVFNRLKHGRW